MFSISIVGKGTEDFCFSTRMTQMEQIFADDSLKKICVNPNHPCHLRAEKTEDKDAILYKLRVGG